MQSARAGSIDTVIADRGRRRRQLDAERTAPVDAGGAHRRDHAALGGRVSTGWRDGRWAGRNELSVRRQVARAAKVTKRSVL
jgi:hypothetical protein